MHAYKIVRIPGRTSLFAKGKYCLSYPRDSVVSAPSRTWGIMCFVARRQARKFIRELDLVNREAIVIKVEGLSEPFYPERISWITTENVLDYFYSQDKHYLDPKAPEGTVCFQQVRVLDYFYSQDKHYLGPKAPEGTVCFQQVRVLE